MMLIEQLRDAVARAPHDGAARHALGLALIRRGEHREALQCLVEAEELAPTITHRLDLSRALIQDRQHERCVALLERTVANAPDSAECCIALGWQRVFSDDLADARRLFLEAIRMVPSALGAYTGLARVQLRLNGAAGFSAAMARDLPTACGSWPVALAAGMALIQLQEYAAAREYLNAWVDREPNRYALGLLGIAEYALGNRDAATFAFERARRPPTPQRVLEACLCHLVRVGDFDAVRALLNTPAGQAALGGSRFVATLEPEAIAGRTVLLRNEDQPDGLVCGFGDIIQWSRIAATLARRGARVVVEAKTPVRSLVARMPGVDGVVVPHDRYPNADVECSALVAVLMLPVDWHAEGPVRFIHPPESALPMWRRRFAGSGAMRIGVEWTARHDQTSTPTSSRSMPVEALRPLADLEDVRCYALTVAEHALRELRAASPPLRLDETADAVHDFADIAAAVEALDAVVTVDTAVAHLAAAMGKPTFVMLRHYACWRWGEAAETSRWYPSIRLFRQPRPGDWQSVVSNVVAAIARLRDQRALTADSTSADHLESDVRCRLSR